MPITPSCVWLFATHELQHARFLCPSRSPGVCSNSCRLSQWYHPAISSYVILSSSCFHSSPASGSFPMSRLFASGGQSVGASVLTSVLPMNSLGSFPLGLNDLSPCCPRDSSGSYLGPQFESISSSVLSLLYGPAVTSLHERGESESVSCSVL